MDEKERNIIDDPTEIDIAEKKRTNEFIYHNIQQVYEYADQWTPVEGEDFSLSSEDMHKLIMEFRYNQNLPIKNIRVNYADIRDPSTLAQLYNYVEVLPERQTNQKIYFIEGSMASVTIIPVQETSEKRVLLYMELLDRSEKFIQDIWREEIRQKGLNDIRFVKPKDLKTKRPKR